MWQMNRLSLRLLIAMLLIVPATTNAAFDYFASNRLLVRNGLQAVLMCNGLYTSHRALADVFDQELSYLVGERFGGIVGTAEGGDYLINADLKQDFRRGRSCRSTRQCRVSSRDWLCSDVARSRSRRYRHAANATGQKAVGRSRHHRLAVG